MLEVLRERWRVMNGRQIHMDLNSQSQSVTKNTTEVRGPAFFGEEPHPETIFDESQSVTHAESEEK